MTFAAGHLLLLGAPTWLLQSGEDGQSAGVLRVRELHDTVIVCLVETQHGGRVVRFYGRRSRAEGDTLSSNAVLMTGWDRFAPSGDSVKQEMVRS